MSNETRIDFHSQENIFFLNPAFAPEEKNYFSVLASIIPSATSSVLVATSGSMGSAKLVHLRKAAFLDAASSVNEFLESTRDDIWLNPLPLFHVGGLSIYARAELSGAKVLSLPDKWSAITFFKNLTEEKITSTSLVPTQLYDLVAQQRVAPPTLRHCIIGGGPLSPALAKEALHLQWPLIVSYGMTETAAMCAAKKLSLEDFSADTLSLFPHLLAKTDPDGQLLLKGNSLLESYVQYIDDRPTSIDPKKDSWFSSDDYATVTVMNENENLFVTPHGRGSDIVKIRGELLNLAKIRITLFERLPKELQGSIYLLAAPDPRNGFRVVLFSDTSVEKTKRVQTALHAILPPFASLSETIFLPQLPYNTMGKVMTSQLLSLIE